MNPVTGKSGSRTARVVLAVALALAVAACASGTLLKWNQVDSAALMNSERGGKKMNTIRFATFGPESEHIFGYFLYKEGVEVITGGGIPLDNLGKLTLREVMDDHVRVIRAKQYLSGSNLIVREVLRGDHVVGFTASDINMEVNIWDITTEKDAKVVLRLVYKDLRRRDGGDVRRDRSPGGR